MIVRIKENCHPDSDYWHLKQVAFEVINPFYDKEWVVLKNGINPIEVLWDDVDVVTRHKPTEEEFEHGCWMSEPHAMQFLPANPMEDED